MYVYIYISPPAQRRCRRSIPREGRFTLHCFFFTWRDGIPWIPVETVSGATYVTASAKNVPSVDTERRYASS